MTEIWHLLSHNSRTIDIIIMKFSVILADARSHHLYDGLALWQTCNTVLLKGATLIFASPYQTYVTHVIASDHVYIMSQ